MAAMTVWKFLLVLVVTVMLGQQSSVLAQSPTAMILYPTNGAVNVDLSQPIQWTSVAHVQAYYLYVGTTRGAKDLVDTGEMLQTSYLVAQLPASQTIYARIWTKVTGAWRYTDSSFSVSPQYVSPVLKATLIYPLNGAVNADLSQPIRWTSVAHAQAYYLYVGTTRGAKNLVDTGEMLQTSYQVPQLPARQTIYVRIWTKVTGAWRYTDSTFSATSVLTATLTYPVNGAVNADLSQPMQWTQRGACAGVLSLCRDDPRRQGSRGYRRDAADRRIKCRSCQPSRLSMRGCGRKSGASGGIRIRRLPSDCLPPHSFIRWTARLASI